jgi:hypothetical protein
MGHYAPGLARPAPVKGTALAAQALTATANINTYASLPTPVTYTLTLAEGPWICLFALAAYVEIAANNVEVALALNITGASTVAAGSHSEDRLHVVAKSPVGTGLSLSDYATVNKGATTFELKYAATGAATVSDVAMQIVPIGSG